MNMLGNISFRICNNPDLESFDHWEKKTRCFIQALLLPSIRLPSVLTLPPAREGLCPPACDEMFCPQFLASLPNW